jgi:hypothetical protein
MGHHRPGDQSRAGDHEMPRNLVAVSLSSLHQWVSNTICIDTGPHARPVLRCEVALRSADDTESHAYSGRGLHDV